MPGGKPAGVRCVQLTPDNRCRLFGKPERPAVCVSLRPSEEMCRSSAEKALAGLVWLEAETTPAPLNVKRRTLKLVRGKLQNN